MDNVCEHSCAKALSREMKENLNYEKKRKRKTKTNLTHMKEIITNQVKMLSSGKVDFQILYTTTPSTTTLSYLQRILLNEM